jgi:hypothetical protein
MESEFQLLWWVSQASRSVLTRGNKAIWMPWAGEIDGDAIAWPWVFVSPCLSMVFAVVDAPPPTRTGEDLHAGSAHLALTLCLTDSLSAKCAAFPLVFPVSLGPVSCLIGR